MLQGTGAISQETYIPRESITNYEAGQNVVTSNHATGADGEEG
jgi:hypothetical protein